MIASHETMPMGLTGGIRAHRLFRRSSGRSFMVAVDRPLVAGEAPGGPTSRELVARAVAAEPEAVVLGPGALKQSWDIFGDSGAPSPVVRIDHVLVGDMRRGTGEHHRMLCSVEEAVALGADAVMLFLIDGFADGERFADNVSAVADTVAQARRLGVPVIVEAVLWGANVSDERSQVGLAFVCRVAAELGADIVKTQHTGDIESMREIVQACSVPVLVLGGPANPDTDALMDYTQSALDAGARGVVFGRNVYLREEAETAASLRALVHGAPA